MLSPVKSMLNSWGQAVLCGKCSQWYDPCCPYYFHTLIVMAMEENLRCWNCQYVTNVCMDWLSKAFGGSTSSFSAREYHGAYGEDTYWDFGQPTSVDLWADDNNDGIDHAIAVSFSEEDQKRQKAIKMKPDWRKMNLWLKLFKGV
ncbi:hypothetical protein Nepgr_017788 [Nepenthes gracilis]|uniref:Uncharacterized protein n=1 Tax=Nepenthes gracilis TaxID=150966 RepID=A0AAD3SSY3_NEPGR|nr:hypothetical protein Nepgr_017788 [Nepenthes gracilis]